MSLVSLKKVEVDEPSEDEEDGDDDEDGEDEAEAKKPVVGLVLLGLASCPSLPPLRLPTMRLRAS